MECVKRLRAERILKVVFDNWDLLGERRLSLWYIGKVAESAEWSGCGFFVAEKVSEIIIKDWLSLALAIG